MSKSSRTSVPSRFGARRFAAVAAASALVFAPALVAAPAFAAETFPAASVTFVDSNTFSGGSTLTAYFDDDPSLVSIPDVSLCQAEYLNGVPYATTYLQTLEVNVTYEEMAEASGAVRGDIFGMAFYPLNEEADVPADGCGVAPEFGSPDLLQQSVYVGDPLCVVDCPTVTTTVIKLVQGTPVDLLVPYTLTGDWDWSEGGWIGGGPQSGNEGDYFPLEGMMFEYQESAPGVAPQLRLHGTPAYSGTSQTSVQIGDYSIFAIGDLTVEIAAPAAGATINLNLAVGAPVAGATANVYASGLNPGAEWSITVRSTPIVVGSGVVGAQGQVFQPVTIPAGLAAGIHSITLASTLADGSTLNTVLWFKIGSNGNLVSTSLSQAELAATGAVTGPIIPIAGGLLLTGFVMMGAVAYRRRTANTN